MTHRDKKLRVIMERIEYIRMMLCVELLSTIGCGLLALYAYMGSIEPHASEALQSGDGEGAMWWLALSGLCLVGLLYHNREYNKAISALDAM